MVKKQRKNIEDKLNSHMKTRNEQSAHYGMHRNEQSAHYGMPPEASRFFRWYDYRISLLVWYSFFTHTNYWPWKIYLYGSLRICKFLELVSELKTWTKWLKMCVWEGVDIYKVCKPAACSFMKKLTHLQWFKHLANFVKVNILRNSLECLHMIFVSFFSQLQY